jgi:UPF0176 protein
VEPYKILLYYRFTPLTDPEAIRLWQWTLCDSLGLKGRIIISKDGINGTVGGPLSAVKKYIRATKEWPGFKDTDFKWSEGTGDDFPRLAVRVRDELVSFGAPQDLHVDESGVVNGGPHLSPTQVNELVEARGDDVVFFDGRNAFEAEIGRFRNAIVPDVETTHDFVKVLESGAYDHLKDKPIVTYCTGGVRCEVLSSLMLQRGFQEVYQVEGGIVRYGEAFGNEGLWEGSLFIFDGRMNQEFGPNTTIISACERCETPTTQYYNCANLACRQLILLCDTCSTLNGSTNCQEQHHGARYRSKL